MIVVLLVSTGARWESEALAGLQAHPGTAVLRRCVDVEDLLAAASTGQAEVAVVGTDVPGLDQHVLDDLTRYGVRVVGVLDGGDRVPAGAVRPGLAALVEADDVGGLAALVASRVVRPDAVEAPVSPLSPVVTTVGPVPSAPGAGAAPGRVVVVWGPGGGPGRTVVAGAMAGELARRGLETLLVDADPWGGAVAQQLGVLDEVSGLLVASRAHQAGQLATRYDEVRRRLGDRLCVVTGLPRPDRWPDVRPGVLTDLVDLARAGSQVVVDTGFTVELDLAAELGRPGRNDLTREALELADDVVVVGAADPVGLARLVRALDDLREVRGDVAPHVVVNRMRPTLGWREADVLALLDGFGPVRGVSFLPDDQPAVDRAAVTGRLLTEGPESPLGRAVGALVEALADRSVVRR